MSITNEELQKIVKNAYEKSLLAREAIENYRSYKQAIKEDQDAILNQNKVLKDLKDEKKLNLKPKNYKSE